MSKVMTLMNDLIELISMGPFGSDIKVDNFVSEGVPVLNGSNVSSIKLIETSFKYVTPEKSKALKKANAKRGDIVITHRGTVGQISYIPEDSKYDNYVISQSQFRVSLKRDLVDPIYFTYYFHTEEGQKRLLSFKSHVGVPALAQATTNFRLLKFPLIPLIEQQKIAKILSALDNKIELNNKINIELEAMAKTLYDYWFVQFDFPNEEGKPYKSSGGEMVYNEELKREIPKGWEVKKLGEFLNCYDSLRIPLSSSERNLRDGNIPYYGATSVMGYVDKALFSGEYILLAEDGSVMNENGNPILQHIKGEVWVNNHAHVLEPRNKRSFDFLKLTLSKISVVEIMTGSVQKKITQGNLLGKKFFSPPDVIVVSFDEVSIPLRKRVFNNEQQNQELASLRDWLLPMLMNGQVKVGDYKYVVEDDLGMAAEPGNKYNSAKHDL